MSKNQSVKLSTPFTWNGKNYEPGVYEMPEAAANYVVRRKFGKVAGGADEKADDSPTGNAETESGGGKGSENGLPEDFPMRHVFDTAGFKSVAEVQAKSREELIALDGIAEKTADKVLAYGK